MSDMKYAKYYAVYHTHKVLYMYEKAWLPSIPTKKPRCSACGDQWFDIKICIADGKYRAECGVGLQWTNHVHFTCQTCSTTYRYSLEKYVEETFGDG